MTERERWTELETTAALTGVGAEGIFVKRTGRAGTMLLTPPVGRFEEFLDAFGHALIVVLAMALNSV